MENFEQKAKRLGDDWRKAHQQTVDASRHAEIVRRRQQQASRFTEKRAQRAHALRIRLRQK